MPYYDFTCECGATRTRIDKQPPDKVVCHECGHLMRRDYRSEKPISTFHDTRDLYAEKKKWDAKRKRS